MRVLRLVDATYGAIAGSPCLPASESVREEADNYRAIIVTLNLHWRVIECRDAIQWILQRRAGTRHGQPRWDGRCYCRTRQGLLRRVRELTGECNGVALSILERLPECMEARR